MDLTSKQEAAAVGSKFYFTGKICQNGHIDKRYVSTGICYECKRVNMANDYSRNKPRVIATNKKSYNKNSSKHMARSLAWAKKNPEKRKAIRQKTPLNIETSTRKLLILEIKKNVKLIHSTACVEIQVKLFGLS